MPDSVKLRDCLTSLRKQLSDKGIRSAGIDSRLLMQSVTGLDHAGIILHENRVLTEQELKQINYLGQRRLNNEPVSRILNAKEFYGRQFLITPDVLDPRPDTETLVDLALTHLKNNRSTNPAPKILDIGTGSGAIIVSLLSEFSKAQGTATDISAAALQVASKNATSLKVENRLELVQTAWCAGLKTKFDLIVSNPPYINTNDIDLLDRDVKHFDPLLSLDGGTDGLTAYREIIKQAPDKLKSGGLIMLEIGFDQATRVLSLLKSAQFQEHPTLPPICKDLAGNDRVLTMLWP